MPACKNRGNEQGRAMEMMFCYEYMANKYNGTKAAAAAGYAHPGIRAVELLDRVNIQEKIAELKKKYQDTLELKAIDLVKEIKNLAMSNIADMYEVDPVDKKTIKVKNLGELPRDVTAAIKRLKIATMPGTDIQICEIELYDKPKAQQLLAQVMRLVGSDDKRVVNDVLGQPANDEDRGPLVALPPNDIELPLDDAEYENV